MNTLSRATTARFFPDLHSYNVLRKKWSDLINSERRHELTAAHHLLYLAMLGKDWRKAFTPPTNPRKLDNGAFWGWSMFHALESLRFSSHEAELLAPFEGVITSQMLNELRSLLPTANAYTYRPVDFANRRFPFDAYTEKKNEIVKLHKDATNG